MTAQNDYLYASARIRAMEGRLIGREQLEQMLAQPTAAAAMVLVGAPDAITPAAREAWFAEQLAAVYRDVIAMLPTPDAVRFLQYRYDCNNIKTALKCAIRGIACMSMLIGCSTLPCSAYPDMVERRDYSSLPAHMAAAAEAAWNVYARTADPQQIDLLLDRACYMDMCAAAQGEFAADLVRTKIDLTNLMSFLRVLRMGLTAANRALLDAALLPGGYVPAERVSFALSGGEMSLRGVMRESTCAPVFARLDDAQALTPAVLACACDDVWMQRVRAAKQVLFGEAVPIAYLCAWEYAIKNMRILCAGKDAGLDHATIRERMREGYGENLYDR